MLPVLGKKAFLEWCMKEGLIGSSYVCPKCGKSMELRERMGVIVYSALSSMPTSSVNGVVQHSHCVGSRHVERLTTGRLPKYSVRS
ncbi:hypothetical protein TNCV_241861 [Trichonephila clavipes]|uniref:Uncharacterized protein n=1 Tax=Trichonephila clavipes TaxID=2585209 RepID=A0A8X7BDK6_TRICX|nr:hypothetical protein TNCV_241861 [Trichonephila clavipes]